MKHLLSILTLLAFGFIFYASQSVRHITKDANSYASVSKPEKKDTTVSYTLPLISLIENTRQEQSKGGITITCEIVPFTVTRESKTASEVFWADPSKPGYDVWQSAQLPYYDVSPNQFKLNLKIKNKQAHLLKMRDVALAVLNDGIEYKVPKEFMVEEWQAGNVMSGFEKNFEIPGPSIPELRAGKIVEIIINDVPVEYDQAGTVSKRANFTWTFLVQTKTESKSETVNYSYDYTPVETRTCPACNGSKYAMVTCMYCKGTGRILNSWNNQYVTCSTCNGSGRMQVNCTTCSGDGYLSYPKSKRPTITSSVHWSGYWVEVDTKPTGANIQVFDPDKGQYIYVIGMSNCQVQWFRTGDKAYPIIVEYNGKKVRVLPYKEGNKESAQVKIDFTTGEPTVKNGQVSY